MTNAYGPDKIFAIRNQVESRLIATVCEGVSRGHQLAKLMGVPWAVLMPPGAIDDVNTVVADLRRMRARLRAFKTAKIAKIDKPKRGTYRRTNPYR